MSGSSSATVAALPQSTPNVTSPPPVTGRSIYVAAGGDLQSAINGAQPGDEIVLQAGATFVGPFTLPNKSGAGWITIRSDGRLPGDGVRVTAADAANMATLIAPATGESALSTAAGAHNYYIEGLQVTAAPAASQVYNLISLGDGGPAQNTVASEPHDLVLDHMYIHGSDTQDVRRGIGLNSANTAIINSTINNIHSVADSQAIAGWNGTGPYLIQNNDLEAAGENVMFGGADPQIPNALPSDITIRGNDLSKPLSWQGSAWQVKNLLELKIGQRVLIEDNHLSNNWAAAQAGFAVVLMSADQDGTAPWSQTADVTFRRNIVENSLSGINMAATQGPNATPSARFTITDNLLQNIGNFGGSSGGRMFQVLGADSGLDSVLIENNTALLDPLGNSIITFDGLPTTNFAFTNNIARQGQYGIIGTGTGDGAATLNAFAPNAVFSGNQLIGASPTSYGNYATGNSFMPSRSR